MARRVLSSGTLAWLLALAAAWVALAATGYRARDPDSRLYAEISERLSRQPLASWIAPEFPPGWYMSGLFREHPAGLFAPAAVLGALGYPAPQAAYAMNAVYQVAGIVLLQRLAAALVPGLEARALGWLVQLLPIAFTFRVRANHEAAVLLCLVAAVYAVERARREPRFALLTAAGLVGLLLVKGLLAVFGPAVCALWLLSRRLARSDAEGSRLPDGGGWLALGIGTVAVAASAVAYEVAYRAATSEPFWSAYAARQLGVAAAAGSGSHVASTLYNLVFYLARVLWFASPWSVLAAWLSIRAVTRRPVAFGAADTAGGSPPSHPSPARRVDDPAARAGALFAAAVVLLYVGSFSISERRADRYIFPAYYAAGAAGAVAALRRISGWRRIALRLDRPWVPAAAWSLLFLAHLAAGRLGLPTVKVWAP